MLYSDHHHRPDLRIVGGRDFDAAERERRRIAHETMAELAELVARRTAEIEAAGLTDERERDVASWLIETATRTLNRCNREKVGLDARTSYRRIAAQHESYAKELRHHADTTLRTQQ